MPFTLAHAAAALPFRRGRVIPSALVIGTFAPDFEYFVRLAPTDRFGHTAFGIFVVTLPLALVVLWIFHRFVKIPAVMLFPEGVRLRLMRLVHADPFGRLRMFLYAFGSILLGIATHVVWDLFTHPGGWVYHHWPVLRAPVRLVLLPPVPFYKIAQHGSSIIGTCILAIWFMRWYRKQSPAGFLQPSPSPLERITVVSIIATVALLAGLVRALPVITSNRPRMLPNAIGQAIITAIALSWWQLVAYGIFCRNRRKTNPPVPKKIPDFTRIP